MGRKTIDVIVNPRAGAGRAGRVVGDVVRELARVGYNVELHRTERPGHAGVLMRELVLAGGRTVAVMGGDGSFHESLAGLRDAQGQLDARDVTIALIPAGTGGDLKRSMGVPEDPAQIAEFIRDATPTPMDLGLIEHVGTDGARASRLFGNVASFGVGGLVDKMVNEGPKWLGGKLTFFVSTLRASFAYKNVSVRVDCDGERFYQGPAYAIAVANGRFFGGGMQIAPNAALFDGLFEVIALGDMNRVESTLLARNIYDGSHLSHRKVSHTRAKIVHAVTEGLQEALLDVDGEAPGRLEATFTVCPGAVRALVRA
jgi:YegS/Rv2252/BmrU family lipid kinase